MKRRVRKIEYAALLVLLLALLLSTAVLAQPPIETTRACSVTLKYLDEGSPIPGASFSLYRVGYVFSSGEIGKTGDFTDAELYPVSLDCVTSADWLTLASTLQGLVEKNAPAAYASGTTLADGTATIGDLLPGLYLVLGAPVTVGDYIYTATPFMLFLPARNDAANTWDYDTEANIKYEKEYNPPDEPPDEPGDDTVTRKVLKVWNDEGREDARPESVTVELYCDGKLYDTVTLSDRNNWRYTWDKLPQGHRWSLVEQTVKGYTTTVELSGITFIVTNTPGEQPPGTGVITVTKSISGDKPALESDFTFVLRAKDADSPMPSGSTDGARELVITGEGSAEFAPITFTRPGVYEYTVSEINGGEDGYTYDTEVYTVRFEVTENAEGGLTCTRTITKSGGAAASDAEFVNEYKTPPTGPTLPQTGLLWWPVPLLLGAGLISLIVGFTRRRRHG